MALIDRISVGFLVNFTKATNVLSLLAFLATTLLMPIGVTVSELWLLSSFGVVLGLALASLIAFGIARNRGAQLSFYFAVLPLLLVLSCFVLLG